jgi:hypothetical protein
LGHPDLSQRQAGRAVLPVALRVIGLCLWLGLVSDALAAPDASSACDATLLKNTPRTRPTYYADRGAYCEGTISVPDAGSIDLVGLQIGQLLAVDAGKRFALRLPALPVPLPTPLSAIRMTAVDAGGKLNYRLDAALDSKGISVDSSVVIEKIGLPLSDIAFLASAETGASVLNFPVVLGTTASGQVDAIYVASMPVRRLRVSVVETDSLKPAQDDVVLDNLHPRTPIHVPLMRKATGRWVDVNAVAFSYLGDDALRGRSYRVFLPAVR